MFLLNLHLHPLYPETQPQTYSPTSPIVPNLSIPIIVTTLLPSLFPPQLLQRPQNRHRQTQHPSIPLSHHSLHSTQQLTLPIPHAYQSVQHLLPIPSTFTKNQRIDNKPPHLPRLRGNLLRSETIDIATVFGSSNGVGGL